MLTLIALLFGKNASKGGFSERLYLVANVVLDALCAACWIAVEAEEGGHSFPLMAATTMTTFGASFVWWRLLTWRRSSRLSVRLTMEKRFVLIPVALALLVGSILIVSWLSKPRVVLKSVAPDGTEICVHQFFTATIEPFYTSIFSKKPGGTWGWFYYDHQHTPWINGRIEVDITNNVARIFRGQRPVGSYDWTKDTFTHFLRGTTTGPEKASWTPEQKRVTLSD